MNLDEFLKRYTSGDDAARVVYYDEIKKTASGESPFLIVRSGDKVLVINPMAFEDHISLDVHAFIDGKAAGVGMFGMTEGRRFEIETDHAAKSHGWDAVALATVLLGEQTTSDPAVVAASTFNNTAADPEPQQPGTHRVAVHAVWSEVAVYAEDIEIDVPDAFTGDPTLLLDTDDDEFDDEQWAELGVDPTTVPANFKTKWLERATFAVEEVNDRTFHDSHVV